MSEREGQCCGSWQLGAHAEAMAKVGVVLTGGTQGDDEEEEEAFNQEEREEISHMAMELVIEEHVEEFSYPDSWAAKPGCQGFNTEALGHMRAGGVVDDDEHQTGGEAEAEGAAAVKAQLHQKTVSFLLHPRTPVHRMLVRRTTPAGTVSRQLPRSADSPWARVGVVGAWLREACERMGWDAWQVVHCTGSGKTLTMIRALDNFFLDPRPKVAVFPTDAVCKNFYRELGWCLPACVRE